METVDTEEKYARIRETIRRVILPLVQSIYEVEPPDIELFCSQFFESQLRKRESKEKDVVDCDLKRIEEYNDKNHTSRSIEKGEDSDAKVTSSTSTLQGSASDPVLTSEKCHGVSLRETSSWDIAPNHPKLDGRRTDVISDLSDAKCGIGDQLCLEKQSDVDPKMDRKACDEYSNPNIEDEILGIEVIVPRDDAKEVSGVSPSAPPYEDQNSKLENSEIVFDNSETTDPEIEVTLDYNSTLTGNKTNLISRSVSDDASGSYPGDCMVTKDCKISSKPLSPNSSFGFIPHLNETCVRQESPNIFCSSKSPRDADFEKGTVVEVSDLAGQFSETLQDLAQKFDSAETNLDVEFQKAKEISDVMHGRNLGTDFIEKNNLNFIDTKEDASTLEKNYNSSSEETDSYVDVEDNNIIISEMSMSESGSETQREDKSSISPEFKEADEDFETVQYENEPGSSKIQAAAAGRDINEEESKSNHLKQYSFIQEKHLNVDKSRKNIENSSPTVDEEWRKRWYEAHPCLDNTSNRLRQAPQRGNMGSQFYISAPNDPTLNPIGEAGDVPPDLFRHASASTTARNLRHLESNSRKERSVSFSPILEEHHFSESYPAETHPYTHEAQPFLFTDEIQRKENITETFNNLDKDVTKTTKTAGSCSSNIPYAWRKMSKHQARYLETEKEVLKQLHESFGGAVGKEKQSIGNSKDIHIQASHDNLSEVVVEKQEKNKSIYDKETNNEFKTSCTNEIKDFEKNSCEQNFEGFFSNFEGDFKSFSVTPKNLQSSPLIKSDISKANGSQNINLQDSEFDDKSGKNLKTLTEDDCDRFKTGEKPYHGERKETASESQNDQEGVKDTDTFPASERDKVYRKAGSANVDVCENKTPTHVANEDLTSEVKEEIRAYQVIANPSKAEPGLDSAGGDFSSPNINENEDLLNSPEYIEHDSSPGLQEITEEYVGEIIERMMQQDSFSDSYDGLNFSSYSDNDSSDMESEYSGAEDSNIYAEINEP